LVKLFSKSLRRRFGGGGVPSEREIYRHIIARKTTNGIPRIPLPQKLKTFIGTSVPISEPYLQSRNNAAIPLRDPNINESNFFCLETYVISIIKITIPHII